MNPSIDSTTDLVARSGLFLAVLLLAVHLFRCLAARVRLARRLAPVEPDPLTLVGPIIESIRDAGVAAGLHGLVERARELYAQGLRPEDARPILVEQLLAPKSSVLTRLAVMVLFVLGLVTAAALAAWADPRLALAATVVVPSVFLASTVIEVRRRRADTVRMLQDSLSLEAALALAAGESTEAVRSRLLALLPGSGEGPAHQAHAA